MGEMSRGKVTPVNTWVAVTVVRKRGCSIMVDPMTPHSVDASALSASKKGAFPIFLASKRPSFGGSTFRLKQTHLLKSSSNTEILCPIHGMHVREINEDLAIHTNKWILRV